MRSPLPCFLHLFNLFAVHFEPFPWKTWHNTIYFYLNCYSGHVWNVHYSCIIHGHYWRSVCKSALLGTPETAAESCVLINCIVSFPEKRACSAFWGKMTVSWNNHAFERDRVAISFAVWCTYFSHAQEVFSQVDLYGSEALFRPRLWPAPGKTHGRVVGLKKKKSSVYFVYQGMERLFQKTFPIQGEPRIAKGTDMGSFGKCNFGALLPFLSLSSLFKVPSCSEDLLP